MGRCVGLLRDQFVQLGKNFGEFSILIRLREQKALNFPAGCFGYPGNRYDLVVAGMVTSNLLEHVPQNVSGRPQCWLR